MTFQTEHIDELIYTQRLANVDNAVRMRALLKLKAFLKVKSSTKEGFSCDGLIRIWKGLYYCMYMADKPLVQEDLAEDVSCLIHNIATNSQKILYFKTGLDTFVREWNGIDKFRMDKFMMLFTRMVRQILIFLRNNSWNSDETKKVIECLESSIICPFDETHKKPLGLKMHLAEIILEEMSKVSRGCIPDDVLLMFIYPFLKVLAISRHYTYIQAVKNGILNTLIKQSDLGIKNQEDMTLHEIELVEEEEDKSDKVETNEEPKDIVLDPRAGSVDVYLPQLKPDYVKVALLIQSLGTLAEVADEKRQLLYYYAKIFINLAHGVYSFEDLSERRKSMSSLELEYIDKIKERLIKEGKHIKFRRRVNRRNKRFKKWGKKLSKEDASKKLKEQKKLKSTLFSKMKRWPDEIISASIIDKECKEPKPKKVKVSPKIELSNSTPTPAASKLGKKKNKLSIIANANANANCEVDCIKKLKKQTKEKNKVKSKQNVSSDVIKEVLENVQLKPQKLEQRSKSEALVKQQNSAKKVLKAKTKNAILNTSTNTLQNKLDKKAKATTNVEEGKNSENKLNGMKTEGTQLAKKTKKALKRKPTTLTAPAKKTKVAKVADIDPWDEPLQDGETEIIIFKKTSKAKVKNRKKLIIKKPCSVNTKGKILKINLRKNKEHDWKDYAKSIRSSPGLPFAASKKPLHSVLKPVKKSFDIPKNSITSRFIRW